MDALFFWFFSIAMIVCGLAVILNRNPVASAICFAFTIFYMAGLFVMLDAYFLAAVQILVTAGAVMVLFLFIIMLLDLTAFERIPRQQVWMGCSLVLALGFIYLVARTLNDTPVGFVAEKMLSAPAQAATPESQTPPGTVAWAADQEAEDKNDDTHQIGRLLFTTYVAPFEVTSLLILVATVGVIVLCKQEPKRPSPREEIAREAPPIKPQKETTLTH
jgi:NADH-quinone oxidoreductase subunit J